MVDSAQRLAELAADLSRGIRPHPLPPKRCRPALPRLHRRTAWCTASTPSTVAEEAAELGSDGELLPLPLVKDRPALAKGTGIVDRSADSLDVVILRSPGWPDFGWSLSSIAPAAGGDGQRCSPLPRRCAGRCQRPSRERGCPCVRPGRWPGQRPQSGRRDQRRGPDPRPRLHRCAPAACGGAVAPRCSNRATPAWPTAWSSRQTASSRARASLRAGTPGTHELPGGSGALAARGSGRVRRLVRRRGVGGSGSP